MPRRIIAALAAAFVLAAAPVSLVAPASAAPGTCDPATRGMAYNEVQQDQGPVVIYARFTWDGVSVMPDCDGPIILLRGTNMSATETWYVHFQGRKGTWRTVTLTPGISLQVTSSGQLRQLGLPDASDLAGLYITQSSTPPQVT